MSTGIINRLKWILRPYYYSFKWRKSSNETWIFGRIACMGQDVLNMLISNPPLRNIQKGRVDYLNDVMITNQQKVNAAKSINHIIRDDIKVLILQQYLNYFKQKKAPSMLFMDSYSELTDQRFYRNEKQWSFCANYSDVNHSDSFKQNFTCKGLLPAERLYNEYFKFFTAFRERYKGVPILFLHFPVKLDKREKFKMRYSAIKEAIERIGQEFEEFYSFEADDEIVNWPEEISPGLEKFPYHYNLETYKNLAQKIEKSGALEVNL